MAQDRDSWWSLVNAVIYFWVILNAGYFLTRWEPFSFSGKPLVLGVI
jgi:hypothetical protein